MTENLIRRTLKSAAWLGGASVVRLGLRVISVAILARLLTPEEYGIMAGALVVTEFATVIYALGLALTLIQRKELRPDQYSHRPFALARHDNSRRRRDMVCDVAHRGGIMRERILGRAASKGLGFRAKRLSNASASFFASGLAGGTMWRNLAAYLGNVRFVARTFG